jgi:hypothetical protein
MGYTGHDIKLTGEVFMTLDKEDMQALKVMFEPLEAHITALEDTQQAILRILSVHENQNQTILNTLSEHENQNQASQDTQQAILRSLAVIENVQYPRIAAALDGYAVNRDKLDEHDGRISFLERKADIHDTRLYGLEQEKQKA